MTTLAEIQGEMVALAAVGGSLLVAVMAIVGSIASGISKTRQREQSRRELAAYVAEGSMTPDEAERLLKAGAPTGGCGGSCSTK